MESNLLIIVIGLSILLIWTILDLAVQFTKVAYYEAKIKYRMNQFSEEERKNFTTAMKVKNIFQLRKWLKGK